MNLNDFNIFPSYEQIYLRPNLSKLVHRADADTSVEFLGRRFNLPVVPANMEDVIGFENAKWLSMNGYFYIMHRFKGATNDFVEYALQEKLPYISISVGANDESQTELRELFETYGDVFDYITIDVAHGHHQNVADMVEFIRDSHDTGDGDITMPKIIAGNVCTSDGYDYLCRLGVDAIKVGIGGGSICTTKLETGFHMPTAASLIEIGQRLTFSKTPVIADGGIRSHGDIAKALGLGAVMVMCGNLFASCIDSPAAIVHGRKIYRGSTSYAAKGHDNHVEGKTLELEGDLTYVKRIEKMTQALKSSISYAGGHDLKAFSNIRYGITI